MISKNLNTTNHTDYLWNHSTRVIIGGYRKRFFLVKTIFKEQRLSRIFFSTFKSWGWCW